MKAGKKKAATPTRAKAVRAIHGKRGLELDGVMLERRVPTNSTRRNFNELVGCPRIVGKYYWDWAASEFENRRWVRLGLCHVLRPSFENPHFWQIRPEVGHPVPPFLVGRKTLFTQVGGRMHPQLHNKKMSRPCSPLRGKTGTPWFNLPLLRSEVLVVAQAYDVLEHGRAGRQVRRIQELGVEEIVTFWGAVHSITTLEIAGVVLRVVHAHHGSCIVHGRAVGTAIFQIAQEVVHTAVGTEVLPCPVGLREGNALAGRDRHAVITGIAGSTDGAGSACRGTSG